MTTTTTYLSDLSRVRISFTGLTADADYAVVQRSTDGITWTTVRGGDKVGLSGGAGKVDDYEFIAGAANTYRVTAIDSAAVQPAGAGGVATGNNSTLNPPLPAGAPNGAMLLLFVSHFNNAATITTPSGWTRVLSGATNMAVFYRTMAAGVTAPSVAFSGGTTGDSCSAYIRAWTNADAPVHVQLLVNAAAQNVAYPGGALAQDGVAWVMHAWKGSAATGAAPPSLFGDQVGSSNTAGANVETNLSWRTDATVNIRTVVAGTMAWSGGSSAASKARLLRMTRRANVGVETSTITPVLDSVWIKNVRRPSLNRRVTVTDVSEIERPSRSEIVDVVGRTMPIATDDVRGSRRLTLQVSTLGYDAADDFDNALSTGHTVFVQAPTLRSAVPTMYASIGNSTRSRPRYSVRSTRRYFDLPLTEVAAPASTVYSDTFTYADVLATYATIADQVAANASYSALVDKVSTAVVIVP
ncbi:hypothetical protein [Amycolatopsis solani]|uniref:hypothetical protein n=1 Tax=Amycolatopsis solani TaxID=3028615 RepID=UPI0025B1582B|nr:hypothetical protein [Amycolatopsis sp. MEP2-6]